MTHLRTIPALFALCALVLAAPGFASAEEKKPAPAPETDSDEDAAEALAVFKKAIKAKGLKGDDKIAEQAYRIRELAEIQHPKIVEALAKTTKHRTVEVRTEAVLQLGKQRACPSLAGKAVLAAMKRNEEDHTFTMAGLESIGALEYLGAKETLKGLINHSEYAVVKNTLVTIGKLKDTRFIDDIIKLMKKLKIEKGAKWDGVSVTYDTGTAGTHDQEMAEKIGKEKEAKNRGKGRSAARSQRDLGPVVLQVAKDLTGQEFSGSISARKWADANKKMIKEWHDRDDQREKNQKQLGK